MAEKLFANGLRIEKPNEKAPSFVKGKISIKVDDFVTWLTTYKNERGWVNLDIKESAKGSLYAELNTYNRNVSLEEAKKDIPVIDESAYPNPNEEINSNDIPF